MVSQPAIRHLITFDPSSISSLAAWIPHVQTESIKKFRVWRFRCERVGASVTVKKSSASASGATEYDVTVVVDISGRVMGCGSSSTVALGVGWCGWA